MCKGRGRKKWRSSLRDVMSIAAIDKKMINVFLRLDSAQCNIRFHSPPTSPKVQPRAAV